MGQLFIAARRNRARIGDIPQLPFIAQPQLAQRCRQPQLTNKRGQRLNACFRQLLLAFSVGAQAPNIFRKADKLGQSLLINIAIVNGVQYRKPLAMITVGVSAQLVIHVMALEIAFFTHFNDPVFRHSGVPHQITARRVIPRIFYRRAGTTATWDQLNQYFGLMQMPIITSQYWNTVYGASPDEVKQDLEGMQTMRTLGHNIAYFLKCKEVGTKLGIPFPPQEKRVHTHFIRS